MPDQIKSRDAKRRASDALLWTLALYALWSTTLQEHLSLPVTPFIRAVLKCQVISRGWGLLERALLGWVPACYRAARVRGLPQGGKHTNGDVNWNSQGTSRLLGGYLNWTLWPLCWEERVAFMSAQFLLPTRPGLFHGM